MKTFAIACGGTGGHLAPGIAVAEELMSRGHHCFLLVSQKEVDKVLCKNYPQLPYISIPGVGFSRKITAWPKCFLAVIKNFFYSLKLLRQLKIDVVVGFGGFTNVGIILASFCLRKPCFLHEANLVMGKAIRWFGMFATKVYVPENYRPIVRLLIRQESCGFPVRKEIRKLNKEEARQQLNVSLKDPLLVVIGGSQGAKILTQWVIENLEKWTANHINVICVTGLHFQKNMIPLSGKSKIMFIPFYHQMQVLYSAADLVVGRAGAGTIAELTYCETPSILVPYPHAAENHQQANADLFCEQGGCVIVDQSRLCTLADEVIQFIKSPHLLEQMQKNLRVIKPENVTQELVDRIEKYLKQKDAMV